MNPVQAHVARVVDGDTLELDGGTRVRVLGIDSCEMSTLGGPTAKAAAERWIGTSGTVTLTSEPGVNLDRYGRQLRYVTLGGDPWGSDLGEILVQGTDTAVYQGHNDASSAYITALRALDSNGRTCGATTPAPAPAPVASDNHYVPVPTGDDDHHKSRFCRRHWYC